MTRRIDISIDVSSTVPLAVPAETAVSIYIPDSGVQSNCATVLFAYPGPTYTRFYYDLQVPGREGYSFAEYLARWGYIVVACDHVGIGESTPYEPFSDLTQDVVLNADQATFDGVTAQLAAGTLHHEIPRLINPFIIGVGHSMGAVLLCHQQAKYGSFDALVFLGLAVLPSEGWRTAVTEIFSNAADCTRPPRELLHHLFHEESVPDDVKSADDSLATRVYLPPSGGDAQAQSDYLMQAVRSIDVPIFLGFGARDATRDPLYEACAYRNSTDLTIFILSDSGHCSNFSQNRTLLFDRIAGWIKSISR